MANDEDIFKDFEKYRGKKSEEKKENKKSDDQKEITIHLKFNPIWLERLAYWVVIIVLLIILLLNPLKGCSFSLGNFSSSETTDLGGAEIIDVEDEGADEEEIVEEDDDTVYTDDGGVTLSGKITALIATVSTEEDNNTGSLKLTEIRFSVDNQKKGFTPKVKLFVYGSDDPDELKNMPNAEASYAYFKAGDSKDFIIREFKRKYLTSSGATAHLKIYDSKDNTLLATAEKDI